MKRENSKRKVGIKVKLLGALLPVVVCILGIVILFIYQNTSKIIINKSEELLQTSTQGVMNSVTAWMKETITALDKERDTLEFFNLDEKTELDYIKHTAGKNDAFPSGIYIGTKEGDLLHASFVPEEGYNMFEKSWYQEGLLTEEFTLGSVYMDGESQSYVVGASGVFKDKDGSIRGVAAADIYLDAISEIVQEVQLEQTGAMFLIDGNTNMIIGHKDGQLIGTALGGQADGMYSYVEQLIQKDAFGLSRYVRPDGEATYLDVEKVPDSNWIAAAYVPHSEVVADLNRLIRNMSVISVIGILLLVVLMERLIHMIIKPVRKLSEVIRTMTEGDFTADIEVSTRDEIGYMAKETHEFIQVMRGILSQLADVTGKLNAQSVNSARVADNLSGASSLQSGAMNEMNRTVEELTESITEVAENANSLSLLVSEAQGEGETAGSRMKEAVQASSTGRGHMEMVLDSMKDISGQISHLKQSADKMESSISQVNTFVELIGEIAEETNLLSLNASIEAARAGEAGRGFAVVADQIGKLAQNSRNAVEDIAALTQEIMTLVSKTASETRASADSIQASSQMVDRTGEAFNTIYDSIAETDKSVTAMIEEVRKASDIAINVAGITQEQSAASEEILATTETIRQNAENVRADSEAVASDAEELHRNASRLKEQIDLFQLDASQQ